MGGVRGGAGSDFSRSIQSRLLTTRWGVAFVGWTRVHLRSTTLGVLGLSVHILVWGFCWGLSDGFTVGV